jgi:subtilase family serine protease/Tol biopolymer transport system component/fibronectin type 3 domain-containing protein
MSRRFPSPIVAAAGSALIAMALAPGLRADAELLPNGRTTAGSTALQGLTVLPVGDFEAVAVLAVDGDYSRFLEDGAPNVEPRAAIGRAFFDSHADEFDFLLVASSFPFDTGGAAAVAWGVQNRVAGIGVDLFDESAAFGSAGRLLTFVDLGALENYDLVPSSPGFETLLTAAAHEILHTWGAYIRFRAPDGTLSSALTASGAHWSYLFDSQASVLYGNDWRDDGDGTFESLAAEKIWGPLDLYLAGLLGPEEVPPLLLIENDSIDPARRGRAGDRVEGVATVVTIDDIVAAEGPRLPAATDSQRAFRAGVVYLIRPGEQVDGGALAALETFRRALEIRFAVLTGGRASLATHLELPSGGGGGPGGVDPGEIRPGPASLPDAFAWLRARQDSDGSWFDLPETRARDTAVVAETLSRLDALFQGGDAAAAWLASQSIASTDYAARRAAAVARLGNTAATGSYPAELRARQNADGGWGAGKGFASDPLDTALAVLALRAAGSTPSSSELSRAGDYLISVQGSDGAWGASRGGAGRTGPTCAVLRALHELGRASVAAPAALAWLSARQNPDGGFGDSPSTAHDTASVVEVARRLGAGDAIDFAVAVDYLTSRQTVEGSWEGSVYTTALVVEQLSHVAAPDLAFAAPATAEPATPVVGEVVRISVRVRNEGAVTAPASTIALYDGDPATGGQQVASSAGLADLAAGAEAALSLDWETNAAMEGSHRLYVVLDSADAVAEASEGNNVATVDLELAPAPEGVDLAVRPADLAFLPPDPSYLPAELVLVANVRNLGSADASDVVVRAYRGTPAAGALIGEQSTAIAARSAVPVSFYDTVVTPGEHLYTVVVDPANAVSEANESNNEAASTLATTPAIDLEVTAADLAALDPIHPGADVRFRTRLRNRGTVGGGSFDIELRVTDGTWTELLQSSVIQLEPGESTERIVTWRADRTGALSFEVEIDRGNLVPEANESNNFAELAVVSEPLAVANLVVGPGDLSASPSPAREGAPLLLQARVRNNGGVASPPVRALFYDGVPDAGQLLAEAMVPALDAGASTVIEATWAEVPDEADRTIHVVLDPDASFEEYSRLDNSTFVDGSVLSLPDLALSSGALTLLPALPVPGEPVALRVLVANLGEQPASGVVVRAYSGDPENSASPLAETTIAEVAALGSGEADLVWTFSAPAESVAIQVRVDPDDTLREGDETNNGATLEAAVQDADFFVSAPYFSPNGDGVLDSTTLSFRLAAPRQVAVEIRNAWDLTLRRWSDVAWNAGGGLLDWDGRDSGGVVAPDGEYRFLVVDTTSGATLGRVRTVLDTNRSSLLEAIGSPYERLDNATCELPFISDARPAADGRSVFVAIAGWDSTGDYPEGIYRVATDGSEAVPVVRMSQLRTLAASCPKELISTSLVSSPVGDWVAFSTWRDSPCSSRRDSWLVNSTGSRIVRLPEGTKSPWGMSPLLGFYDGGRRLLAMGSNGDLRTIEVANPTSWRVLFPDADSLYWAYDAEAFYFSPDRSRLVLFTELAAGNIAVWLLDLETETPRHLVDLVSDYRGEWENAAWSFDGSRLVVGDRETGRLHLFDADGEPISTVDAQLVPPAAGAGLREATLARTRGSAREAALAVEWSTGEQELVLVDLATGATRRVARVGESEDAAGLARAALVGEATLDAAGDEVRVEARIGERWRAIGTLGATRRTSGTLRLPRGAVDETGSVTLRLSGESGASSVREIALVRGGGRRGFSDATKSMNQAAAGRFATADVGDGTGSVSGSRVLRFEGLRDEPLRIELENDATRPRTTSEVRESTHVGASAALAGEPVLAFDSTPIWVPFDRAVLWAYPWRFWYGESMVGVLFDQADRRVELFSDWTDRDSWGYFDYPRFSDDGQRLFFESGHDSNDIESPCYDEYGSDFYSLRSLLNLGTELELSAAPSGAGLLLTGTAADRNFLRYRLDYASAGGATTWTPLVPASTQEKFAESLATWTPPSPGEYLVRLTVEDRAGNRREVVRRAFSLATPSVTDLWVDPPLFSPNGDGTLDSTSIHYRALEPAHVETKIRDARGAVVRAFSRSHATPEEAWLDWDGRDDSGRPVGDGTYSVAVRDLEQLVEVDTTPPIAELAWNVAYLSCDEEPGPGPQFSSWANLSLTLTHCDPGRAAYTRAVEFGLGATPQEWTGWEGPDFERATCLDEGARRLLGLSLDDYVGKSYRLTVTDEAGNRRVRAIGPAPETLAIGAIKLEEVDPSTGIPSRWSFVGCAEAPAEVVDESRIRLEVGETVRAPLGQLFVQYRAAGAEQWNDSAVAAISDVGELVPSAGVPDSSFDLAWDPAPILGIGDVDLRVRAIDLDGVERLSQGVRLRVRRPLAIAAEMRNIAPRVVPPGDESLDALFERARAAGAIEEGLGLYLVATLESEIVPESVFAFVRSTVDLRYAEYRRLVPLFAEARDGVRRYLFLVEDAELCTPYAFFAEARLPGEPALVLRTAATSVETPCFAAKLSFDRDRAELCGEVPTPGITAIIEIPASEASALQLLTLERQLEDGTRDVLASVVQPVSGRSYELDLPEESLGDGVHWIVARLTGVDGDAFEDARTLVVDWAAPILEIEAPVEGQRYCAGEIAISGSYSESFPAVGRVGYGSESDPARWKPASPAQLAPAANPTEFSLGAPDPNGEAGQLRLALWDEGGQLTCSAPRTVFVDGFATGALAAAPGLISPNGDGVVDFVAGSFAAGEPLTLDLAVRTRGTHEVVHQLIDETAVSDAFSFEWAGDDQLGQALPDGLYEIVATATDACGNAGAWLRDVEIDLTPPTVLVVAPLPSDPLPMIVPIAGVATDANFRSYSLEFGAGASPTTWQRIAADATPRQPPGELLGSWNTFGLEGTFTVRLVADDQAGNASEHRVTYLLSGPERLISSFEALPSPFSPNGDGRRDTAVVRVGVEHEVRLTLALVDESEVPVRELAAGELHEPGVSSWTWDGLRQDGTPAPDGRYRVRLEAVFAENALLTQEEEVEIVLDRTAPAIAVERPRDGFASGEGDVVGTIADLRIAEWTTQLAAQPAGAWSDLARGVTTRQSASLGSLEGLAEGGYLLRVHATDVAENEAELVVPFEVDNTPPEVELLAPADGVVLSIAGGAVPVQARLVDEHPRSWRLELGAGESPSTWLALAEDDQLPEPSAPLFEWLPSGLPDGLYTLRLTAVDRADHEVADAVRVTIDNSPPVVAILQPAAGSWVREATAVIGTASDATLESFVLSLAPAGSNLSSPIGGGTTPVVAGELALWAALPADGAYRLRLAATDRAGNQAATEVDVQVDTHPPGPVALQAMLDNGADARLEWAASSETDVVGYLVERGGVRLTPAPVASTTYLDVGLPEGRFAYTVRAVDRAGWEGEPSEPAWVVVDHTPPLVKIVAPIAAEVVSGSVGIVGTAYSEGDFRELRLSVRPDGGEALLLRRSPSPVVLAPLATWSTVGLPEGSVATVRLEAEDVGGNVGATEVEVRIDNLPPSAPTGLSASVATGSDDVQLTWTAGAEADLLGYLLYRDGVLVNASGGAEGDLRPLAIPAASYLDGDRPDGEFTYVVVAIDAAGNSSAPSAPSTAVVDRRPPHAAIVVPDDGARFDRPLYVRAEAADADVAAVAFEWAPSGSGPWSPFGADAIAPWEATFDPEAASLPYGQYELRAVATDRSGAVDLAPDSIVVEYADVTSPSAPLDVVAQVDGGVVRLSWAANEETDLAGYHVDRFDGAETSRRTAEPLAATELVETSVADGEYGYSVVAVDAAGNESAPSTAVDAIVATPTLNQPFTPTRRTTVDFGGSSRYQGLAEAELSRAGVTTALGATTVDAAGEFAWSSIPLEVGRSDLRARVTSPVGDRTNWAEVHVEVGVAPAPPTDFVASVPGGTLEVELGWSASAGPDVAGYQLLREGEWIPAESPIADGEVVASSSGGWDPSAVLDGDLGSYWQPYKDDGSSVAGEWIEVSWPEPRYLVRAEIDWLESAGWLAPPTAYDLEGWFDGAWVPLLAVRDDPSPFARWVVADPYPTSRVRLVVRAVGQEEGFDLEVRLAELRLVYAPLIAGTAFTETVADGSYEYRVRAIGELGFASELSEAVRVDVGDVEPPDPVSLAATVAGSDVSLSWTASAAADLASYEIFRDGQRIGTRADLSDRTWLDAGLANGTYTYVVVAVDAVGNASPPSNEAVAAVEVAPPAAPRNLVATPVATGAAIDLAWDAPEGPAPASYLVYRAAVSGGPFTAVGQSASLEYRDGGLENGVLHVYVVTAFDALGNESAPSNEASAVPRDTEAPPAPRLVFPARPGSQSVTEVSPTVVAGFAQPGDEVELWRNGRWVGEAVAAAEPAVTALAYSASREARLSPDGRWLWVSGSSSESFLVDLADGTARRIAGEGGKARWAPSAREIYLASNTSVRRYDVATANAVTVATLEQVVSASPSPDGLRLAVLGRRSGLYGLWLYELASGGWTRLVATASLGELWEGAEWSPDGARLAFVRSSPSRAVEVRELATGAVVASLPAVLDPPSWSPDGAALLWSSAATGTVQVWRFDIATGGTTAVTSGPASHANPKWSPAGDALAAIAGGNALVEVDLATGVETHWRSSVSELVEWTRGGRFLTRSGSTPSVGEPPGHFALEAVHLDEGENRLIAVARDAAGNLSEPSAEAIVLLVAGAQPNLALEPADLVVLPATPLAGSTARVSVLVRNTGGAPSPASALGLDVRGPAGFSQRLAEALPVPALAPGAAASFGFDLPLPAAGGEYEIAAVVDAANEVVESSEADNLAERRLVVTSFAAPWVALTTDRTSYGADDSVSLVATVTNGGDTFDGSLELRIEDSAGELVESLPAEPIVDLAYGTEVEIARSWWNGEVFAGVYQARARVVDPSGAPVSEVATAFTIGEQVFLEVAPATDRASYVVGAPVNASCTARYAAGNSVVQGAVVSMRLLDASETSLADWPSPLGDLLPGATATVSRQIATDGLPPGDYRARCEVHHDGTVVAIGEGSFQLLAQPPSFSGALSLSNRRPALSEPLVVRYSVRNDGGGATTSLPLRVRLLAPASGGELARAETVVDLPAGASHDGVAAFATSELELASYWVVLEIVGEPSAGLPTLLLASESFTTADRTPPEATLLQPSGASLLGADSRALAKVLDRHSVVAAAELAIDGGGWLPLALEDAASGVWGATLPPLADGPHAIALRARDAWGNETELAPGPFEIDRTPPVVTITGVADAGAYPPPVAPAISVEDEHPGWLVAQLDGAAFVSGSAVATAGPHVLRAVAEDAAGNRTTTSVAFSIESVEIEPEVRVNDSVALESEGQIMFTIELSATSSEPVTLVVSTADASAVAPIDYGAVTTAIAIAPGLTSGQAVVAIVDDSLDENDESFELRIESAEGATPADPLAVGTILDNDAPPALAIGDGEVAEGDEGAVDLLLPVTLSVPSGLAVEVGYRTVEGSAEAGVDFSPFAGLVTISPGATSAEARIEVIGDRADETDETFEVELENPVNASLGDTTATAKIVDDDLARLSISDVESWEGDDGSTGAAFVVRAEEPVAERVTVDFATEQDSASTGLDFLAASGTAILEPGESETAITVEVVGDDWFEEDERYFVRLSKPTAAVLADAEGIGTIRDDEGCASGNLLTNGGAESILPDGELTGWSEISGEWKPRWGSPPAAVGEAYFVAPPDPFAELAQSVSLAGFESALGAGTGSLVASGFVRSSQPGGRADVEVELHDSAGTLLGVAVVASATGTGSWEPFESEILVPADAVTARVRLLGNGDFDGLVLQALDVATLAVGDGSVVEPSGGIAQLAFPVVLSCPIDTPLSLALSTRDGTATAPADYQPVSTIETVPQGESRVSVTVDIAPDEVAEGAETLFLEVEGESSVSRVVLTDAQGVGTIFDDDFCQRTIGYWSNHPSQWPVSALRLGVDLVPRPTLELYLDTAGGELHFRLARQLIGTKLNLARGSDPSILPIVAEADAFLVAHPIGMPLPRGDRPEADRLKTLLDRYNNGCQ